MSIEEHVHQWHRGMAASNPICDCGAEWNIGEENDGTPPPKSPYDEDIEQDGDPLEGDACTRAYARGFKHGVESLAAVPQEEGPEMFKCPCGADVPLGEHGDHLEREWQHAVAEIAALKLDNERFADTLLRFPEGITFDVVLSEITRCYPDDPYASWLTEKLSEAAAVPQLEPRLTKEWLDELIETEVAKEIVHPDDPMQTAWNMGVSTGACALRDAILAAAPLPELASVTGTDGIQLFDLAAAPLPQPETPRNRFEPDEDDTQDCECCLQNWHCITEGVCHECLDDHGNLELQACPFNERVISVGALVAAMRGKRFRENTGPEEPDLTPSEEAWNDEIEWFIKDVIWPLSALPQPEGRHNENSEVGPEGRQT